MMFEPSLQPTAFEALAPYALFVGSIASTVVALHFPTNYHIYFFPPTLILDLWALVSITPATAAWSPPYLDFCLGLTCITNTIIISRLLCIERYSLVPLTKGKICDVVGAEEACGDSLGLVVRPSWTSLATAMRIWNNPRRINMERRTESATMGAISRYLFWQIVRMATCVLLDWCIEAACLPLLQNIKANDFGPGHEPLVRRFFGFGIPIGQDELGLRAVASVHWIWENIFYLELYHAILAIFFVVVLRFDGVDDWPPLFGSVTEAYTVKRFWGIFWHRITSPNFIYTGSHLSRKLLHSKPGSFSHKTAIAFMVFFFSGLGHSIVAWLRKDGFEERDVIFFTANFALAAVELAVSKAVQQTASFKRLQQSGFLDSRWIRVAGRAVGYLYVFSWMFWMVPRWQYPKLHQAKYFEGEQDWTQILFEASDDL